MQYQDESLCEVKFHVLASIKVYLDCLANEFIAVLNLLSSVDFRIHTNSMFVPSNSYSVPARYKKKELHQMIGLWFWVKLYSSRCSDEIQATP
jgi:hypothetical protein